MATCVNLKMQYLHVCLKCTLFEGTKMSNPHDDLKCTLSMENLNAIHALWWKIHVVSRGENVILAWWSKNHDIYGCENAMPSWWSKNHIVYGTQKRNTHMSI